MLWLFRKRENDLAARSRAIGKAGAGHIGALNHSAEPGRAIRTGIAASAVAHLSVLMLVLLFAEVHPLGSLTGEPVAVDIVTPEEVAERKPEEPALAAQPKPADVAEASVKPAAPIPPPPPPAPPEPAAQPKKEVTPPRSAAKTAIAPPQPQPPPQPPPQPQPSPAPSYAPPQPDLSVKYHVLLGLPPTLPPDAPARGSGDKPGDPFDGPSSQTADIAPTLVSEFRRHLKTCSKLPSSIAPSDRLKIKLRVLMTQDGRLAAEPMLIEASASPKGPALMQGAIGALQACQPYAMLPVDRYGEWKVLDLSFTPQDFAGG
jgi:hypothetical protein